MRKVRPMKKGRHARQPKRKKKKKEKKRKKERNHISIVSLNRKMPLAFITPLTPSGIRYAHSATPIGLVAAAASSSWWREDCPASSEVSATRTRPCSLIVSTRAGTTFCRSSVGHHPLSSSQYWGGGAYQKTRPTYQPHEIITLRNPRRFLDWHGCSTAAINIWQRANIASQVADLTQVIA